MHTNAHARTPGERHISFLHLRRPAVRCQPACRIKLEWVLEDVLVVVRGIIHHRNRGLDSLRRLFSFEMTYSHLQAPRCPQRLHPLSVTLSASSRARLDEVSVPPPLPHPGASISPNPHISEHLSQHARPPPAIPAATYPATPASSPAPMPCT